MMVGASVGMLAAGLTTPLDVVKSRMMVGAAAGQPVATVIKDIVKEVSLFVPCKQASGRRMDSNPVYFAKVSRGGGGMHMSGGGAGMRGSRMEDCCRSMCRCCIHFCT
jgi:hypothetical protein